MNKTAIDIHMGFIRCSFIVVYGAKPELSYSTVNFNFDKKLKQAFLLTVSYGIPSFFNLDTLKAQMNTIFSPPKPIPVSHSAFVDNQVL